MKKTINFVTFAVLAASAGSAFAIPVLHTGEVNEQISLVHLGETPRSSTGPDDWLRFEADQAFSFFYDEDVGQVFTAGLGTQTFGMASANGATATFELVSLDLDLNDTDGFLGGTLGYNVVDTQNWLADDIIGGLFEFENIDATNFNKVTFFGDVLRAVLWGADSVNDVGVDFSFNGGPVDMPEPSTALLLLGAGALGFVVSRRRALARV